MARIYYNHWSKVPTDVWRWKNFTPEEMASGRGGDILIDTRAMDKLQALRDLMGVPFRINSAYRNPRHNALVGGKPLSRHVKGDAFDISIHNLDRVQLARYAEQVGFTGMGFYNSFLHVDTGRKRWWGRKWKY